MLLKKLKQVLKSVDRKFFQERISKYLLKNRRKKIKRILLNKELDTIEISYKKHFNPLSELFDTYGSDKGTNKESGHVFDWHPNGYADFYLLLFEEVRDRVRTVFECGIGTNNPDLPSSMGVRGKPGASLRAWRDFFPNAQVYGADIDSSILFQEERIKTGYMDQGNRESIEEYLKEFNLRELNIVIDDGLHTFEAAKTLFENIYPFLTEGGIYIIEDIHPDYAERFTHYFNSLGETTKYAIFTNNQGIPAGNLIWIRKESSAESQLKLNEY